MSHLPARVARRVLRALPPEWRDRVRSVRTRRSYPLNTRGLHANPEMVAWFAEHGRPVSIVIPSYNDVPLLREALASIAETCAGAEYEVIIVDDFIDPGVAAQLQEFASDRVHVVLKDRRLGFAGTVNVGMERARHDIILLNSDIVAKPGWLEALQYSAYAIDPAIGMVSPKLVYPDGRIQYGGTYYARMLAPQWFGHLHVGAAATKPTANVPGYNRSISGACVYITRDAYERVGPLDDGFWLGFEDVDLGLRAWARGVRCYYQPAALLIHHESASRGYSQGPRELASMRRFWRRHEHDFLARELPLDAPVSFILGAGAEPLWRAYVDVLAEAVRAEGVDAEVLETTGDPDEVLVAALSSSTPRIVVACDWSAATTAWLAGTAGALPVYLLPAMETVAHPHDPALQARIVAGYRPEFDYIAPNRWTAGQLQAEAAWEVRRRIAPALAPEPFDAEREPLVITVGADASTRREVEVACRALGRAVRHESAGVAPRSLAAARPEAIVDLVERPSSLAPFALMSFGAVYLSPTNPRLGHEVLDGYNALLHAPGDTAQLVSSLRDALETESVRTELSANGHASAARAARLAPGAFIDALRDFRGAPV